MQPDARIDYYYNNVREHPSLGYRTPYQRLQEQLPDLDHNIRFAVPILLDNVAVELCPWSGCHVLAQNPRRPNVARSQKKATGLTSGASPSRETRRPQARDAS
jgi:hypothetical protein